MIVVSVRRVARAAARACACHGGRSVAVLVAGAVLAWPAVSSADPAGAPDFRSWALESVIAPAHATLSETATALGDAVAVSCAGDADLATAQAAFHDAADAYQRIQWITFGPALLFDRRFRINFWPDETNALSRQLAETLTEQRSDLLTVDGVAGTSAARQGLPALERLLFAPNTNGTTPGSYACGLAEAIAGNVVAVAGDLEADWQRADAMPGGRRPPDDPGADRRPPLLRPWGVHGNRSPHPDGERL